MPFRFLLPLFACLFRVIAIAAACISLAHAADRPSVINSSGKLLPPAAVASAPAAGNRKLTVTPTGQGRRIALVIGNGDYKYPENLPKLANPTHDAEDIAEALRGFGFEVIERKNQTLEGMSQAVAEFGSKIGGSEAALFYFAGHGIQVKNQNYLMPVSAKIESEAAVPFQGLNVNQILEEMDNGKSGANIVMLDACRNNPISGKFRSGASRGLASPGNAPQGTVIVYATDPGNTAADGEGRNGLFSAGLLAAFKGGDLSLDGVLTTASEYVEQKSLDSDPTRKQTPYVNGPKTLQKNFHFHITVDPGRGEIEKTYWTSIERSTDATDFEAYLRKYPKGSYRDLAKNKISRLKTIGKAVQAPVLPSQLLAVTVPPAPTRLKMHALLIGNGKYPEAPLITTVTDVMDMRGILKDLGFIVTYLLDTDRAALLEGIKSFGVRIDKEKPDVVVTYYSGHGVLIKGEDYLLPIDVVGKLQSEQDVQRNGLALFEASRLIGLDKVSGLNVVIYDAVRNNPFSRDVAGQNLVRDYDMPRTIFVFATRPGAVAKDGGTDNGLFTASLIKNLKHPGIEFKELVLNVRREVSQASKGQQEVVVSGDFLGFPSFHFSGSASK